MARMFITTHAVDQFQDRHARHVPHQEAHAILRRLAHEARMLPDLTFTGEQQWISEPSAPYQIVMVCKVDERMPIPLVCVTVLPKQPEYLTQEQRLADELLRRCEIDLAMGLVPSTQDQAQVEELPPAAASDATETEALSDAIEAAPATKPPEPMHVMEAQRQAHGAEVRVRRTVGSSGTVSAGALLNAQQAEASVRRKLAEALAHHAKETDAHRAVKDRLIDLLVGALPLLRDASREGYAYADRIVAALPDKALAAAEQRLWAARGEGSDKAAE